MLNKNVVQGEEWTFTKQSKLVGVGVAGVDAEVVEDVADVVEDVADKVCSQEYLTAYISYDIQLRNLGTNFWFCPFFAGPNWKTYLEQCRLLLDNLFIIGFPG